MSITEDATEMGRFVLDSFSRYIDFVDRQPSANIVILGAIAGLLMLALVLSLYIRRPRPSSVSHKREEIATRRDPIVVERLSLSAEAGPMAAAVVDTEARFVALEKKLSSLQESLEEQASRLQKVRTSLLSIEGGVSGLALRLEKDEGQNGSLGDEVAALRTSIKDLQERLGEKNVSESTVRRAIPARRREKLSGEIAELVEELSRA